MSFLYIEVDVPGLQVADVNDRVINPGDTQDEINGAVDLLMALASGTQDGSVTFGVGLVSLLQPPTSPIPLAVLAGNAQVTPSWPAVSGAVSYNLYYNTTGNPTTNSTKIVGAVSGVPITGLTNSTTYYYLLTAVGANEFEFAASLVVSATPSAGSLNLIDSIMGVSSAYEMVAYSTITNTGNSVVTGNVGISPGTALTGFPPGTISGSTNLNNASAVQAQSDVLAAYNYCAAQPSTANLSGQDLGGMSLAPGVYTFNSSAQLTGTLVLNGGGNANAQWIFQIGSTLTTATNAVVSMINGASEGNVCWQVGSSATIGTGTTMAGNILALASITMVHGSNSAGKLLARTGAVTLDTNVVD